MRGSRLAWRLAASLLYAGYLCAFALVVVYLVFWHPFVRDLAKRRKPHSQELWLPRHVDAETMRRVGFISAEKRSSFVHFEREKPAGTLRLCAFGDSFTYGDEVGEALDFPSLLQDLFDARGAHNVQVLNFGSGWHGFHQAFMIWKGVGRGFGCDVVLLGPACFQPDRDTSFNHTGLRQPYFLHARYALEGSGVRLVEVGGVTHEDRFDDYFRFFPRWRYLRWDHNAPPVLQSLIPRGRELPNFLYYQTSSLEKEAYATYRVLLAAMADDGARVVLRHVSRPLVELARELDRPNLLAVPMAPRFEFPYAAPKGHRSAFGNDLVARHFLSSLLEDALGGTAVLETSDFVAAQESLPAGAPARAATSAGAPALAHYQHIEVLLGEQRAGHFVTASPDPEQRGKGSPSAFHGSKTVSLLALGGAAGKSALDAPFVALDFELRGGAPVALRFELAGHSEERELGRIRLLDERVNLGVVKLVGVGLGLRDQDHLLLEPGTALADDDLRQARELRLFVDGRPVLRGARLEKGFELVPLHGALWRVRAGGQAFTPIDALAETGLVSFQLTRAGEAPLRVPVARWRKKWLGFPGAGRSLDVRIVLEHGQARLRSTSMARTPSKSSPDGSAG